MSIKNVMAGIAVGDLEAGIAWYRRFFGRSFDSRPMKEVAEWTFSDGGWVQVFADAKRVGSSSMTVMVDSLDQEMARLEKERIAVGKKVEANYVDIAEVTDPDGNRLVLAQKRKATD